MKFLHGLHRCRRNELKDLIAGEKLEEESWEKELRDITKFYRDSKEKYTRYVIVS